VVIVVFWVAGFLYWDYTRHRQVEKYVALSSEIPGAEVTGESPAGFENFIKFGTPLPRK
jgi:hypothetical protein